MLPSLDIPFEWRSPAYPNPDGSMCRLRKYDDTPMGTVVVLSEVWTNPGCSVTNGAPELLAEVCKGLGFDPEQTFFIEHYDANSYEGGREEPTFSRVRIDDDGHPVWSHLPPAMICQMVGSDLFDEHSARLAELRERQRMVG